MSAALERVRHFLEVAEVDHRHGVAIIANSTVESLALSDLREVVRMASEGVR